MFEDAMKDVHNDKNLTNEEYLQNLFDSRNNGRRNFEYCYYSNTWCGFRGKISRPNKKKGKAIFDCIYISGGLMDGDCYEGKEDYVWMYIKLFEK